MTSPTDITLEQDGALVSVHGGPDLLSIYGDPSMITLPDSFSSIAANDVVKAHLILFNLDYPSF